MFILLIIIDKFVIDICHMLAKSICQKAKRSNTPIYSKQLEHFFASGIFTLRYFCLESANLIDEITRDTFKKICFQINNNEFMAPVELNVVNIYMQTKSQE